MCRNTELLPGESHQSQKVQTLRNPEGPTYGERGMRKNMSEVSSAISTGLFPSYHKCWAPGPPSLRSISPGLFGSGLVTKPCLTLPTSWTLACQAPLTMQFSRQESWSGLPLFSPHQIPRLAPSDTLVSLWTREPS